MTKETEFSNEAEKLFSESMFAGAPVNGVYSIGEEALNCFFRHLHRMPNSEPNPERGVTTEAQ